MNFIKDFNELPRILTEKGHGFKKVLPRWGRADANKKNPHQQSGTVPVDVFDPGHTKRAQKGHQRLQENGFLGRSYP
jgi:hypothetical protein